MKDRLTGTYQPGRTGDSGPSASHTPPSLLIPHPERVAEARIRAVAFDFDDTLVRLPVEWQEVMAEYFVGHIHGDRISHAARITYVVELRDHIRRSSGTPLTVFMQQLRDLVVAKRLVEPRTVDEYRAGFDRLWRRTTAAMNTAHDLVPGASELLSLLKGHGIDRYVVTGGDVEHKASLMARLGIADYIPPCNVFGDGDDRIPGIFSKARVLRHIRETLATRQCAVSGHPAVAMIGDGRADMASARAADALAIGFNQPIGADIQVTGEGYPAVALTQLLVAPGAWVTDGGEDRCQNVGANCPGWAT